MVVLPILRSDDGRSLPQTFRGGMITSKEIKGLTLYGGQMRQNSPRDDGSMDDMFYAGVSSDRFNFAGGEYELGAKTKVGAGMPVWKTSTSRTISSCCTPSRSARAWR